MTIDCQILRGVDVQRTPRVQQLEGIFDVPPAQRSEKFWRHKFDIGENWNIGVIVGPSGSGKTTLAHEAFGEKIVERWDWPTDKSILDGFPAAMGIRDITGLLCSVGFSSPPAWVRPFHALSNGEQFRVNLARTLAEMPDLAVVDEFTSVVDRTAARIGSAAVAKAVRQRGQKFVAVTCLYDVLDWLSPDWVYEPHTGKLETSTAAGDAPARGRVRPRPPIELEIVRVYPSAWNLFKSHHYLSAKLHPNSQCFLALARVGAPDKQKPRDSNPWVFDPPQPAAFVATLPFPHPIRPGYREHRLVCLPDFQGVGIGNALSEFVASLFTSLGKPYFSTTSHPGIIRHRANSPNWRMRRPPSFTKPHKGFHHPWNSARNRLTAGFEYVGRVKG